MKKCLFLTALFLALPFCAKAAVLEVRGYAWSENIGWISFNSKDSGGDSAGTYAVKLDTATGYFSGHAWSEHVGWISFNRSETGAPPSNPGCGNACIARVAPVGDIGEESVNVRGWARVLSNMSGAGGPWDGWIRFDHGRSQEVSLGAGSPWYFSGYAWGSDAIGWIAFSGNSRVSVYIEECTCSDWIESACGAGGYCATSQRRETRDCTPDGCAVEIKVTEDTNPNGCYFDPVDPPGDPTDTTDCWYNICQSGSCIQAQGGQPDQCTYGDDSTCCSCTTSGWSGCGEEGCEITQKRQYLSCTPSGCLPSLGVCQNSTECYHSECNDSSPYECIGNIPGPGTSECTGDSQCRHQECTEDLKCIYTPGAGTSECSLDSNCCVCTPWEWSECGYGICPPDRRMRVRKCPQDCDIEEIPVCQPSTACYHTECSEELKCEVILGEGANQCGSPASPEDDLCEPIIWDWWEVIARQFGG